MGVFVAAEEENRDRRETEREEIFEVCSLSLGRKPEIGKGEVYSFLEKNQNEQPRRREEVT